MTHAAQPFLTRIPWSDTRWRGPSSGHTHGERGTHHERTGYGYDDWLFRDDWVAEDGFRYAFLQGAHDSRTKYGGRSLEVLLWTRPPGEERRIVARIRRCEVLDASGAAFAMDAFRRNGWWESMRRDVLAAGKSDREFEIRTPPEVFSVRFRPADVVWFSHPFHLPPETPLGKKQTSFYKLETAKYPMPVEWLQLPPTPAELPEFVETTAAAAGDARREGVVERGAVAPTSMELRHNAMQNRLAELLRARFGSGAVHVELEGVDVRVVHPDADLIFEIKTETEPRLAVRDAVGQLLEYAFYRTVRRSHVPRLVVVAPSTIDTDTTAYLALLHDLFGLLVEYVAFDEHSTSFALEDI